MNPSTGPIRPAFRLGVTVADTSLAERLMLIGPDHDPDRAQRVQAAVKQWLGEASAGEPRALPDACLGGIASVLAHAELLGMDAIPTLRELLRRAGGEHLPAGTFKMILLDITDRVGRLPAKVLLSLCRGLALGVSMDDEGRTLPPVLRRAAVHVLDRVDLPGTRRTAMVEALLLEPR